LIFIIFSYGLCELEGSRTVEPRAKAFCLSGGQLNEWFVLS